jgi:nucleoside-diphosphate-sugar epimerase
MEKKKADPKKPPIEDLQGHVYQHELGDPERSQQIEKSLEKHEQDNGSQTVLRPGEAAGKHSPSVQDKTGQSPKPAILVTGSAGLIGSRVVQGLSSEYKMIGLDLKPPRHETPGADFVQCDLTSDESVAEALSIVRDRHGESLASVIHLAAFYDFTGEPSDMYEKLTVQGTSRLLRELRHFDVGQFVFSSTILVMEPANDNELLTEDSPLEDEPWDYPRSKIETEKRIRLEHGDTPVVILRIGGVYDEYGHAVPIAQQINRIYQQELESYLFPGNASHGQAFVHIDDLLECFRKVVERRDVLDPVDVFLIAEPDLMSYKELQDEIGRLLFGKDWKTVWVPRFLAKAGAWAKSAAAKDEETFIKPWMIDLADDHYPVSIRRAQEELGWDPKRRLRTTLPEIIQHLKDDPIYWFEVNKLPVPDDLARRKTDIEERRIA